MLIGLSDPQELLVWLDESGTAGQAWPAHPEYVVGGLATTGDPDMLRQRWHAFRREEHLPTKGRKLKDDQFLLVAKFLIEESELLPFGCFSRIDAKTLDQAGRNMRSRPAAPNMTPPQPVHFHHFIQCLAAAVQALGAARLVLGNIETLDLNVDQKALHESHVDLLERFVSKALSERRHTPSPSGYRDLYQKGIAALMHTNNSLAGG